MRSLWLSDADEHLVEAEPGALWLELDNALRVRGRGLTVYPTSAPRATIGGWLAQDGVGPSEYGRLSENVVSADVVMPGGTHRTVAGDKLHPVVGCEKGIVVRATLQTGRAENDTPWLSRAARSLPGPWQASCARKCRCGTRPSSAPRWPASGGSGRITSSSGHTPASGEQRSKRRCGTLPHPPAGACYPRPTRTGRGECVSFPSRPRPLGQDYHRGGGDPGSPEGARKRGRPGHGRRLGRGAADRPGPRRRLISKLG
jgi:hypothetical protein